MHSATYRLYIQTVTPSQIIMLRYFIFDLEYDYFQQTKLNQAI